MTLAYEGMALEAEPGLTFTAYTAEPGSASAERVRLLASWAASEYGGGFQPTANDKSDSDPNHRGWCECLSGRCPHSRSR